MVWYRIAEPLHPLLVLRCIQQAGGTSENCVCAKYPLTSIHRKVEPLEDWPAGAKLTRLLFEMVGLYWFVVIKGKWPYKLDFVIILLACICWCYSLKALIEGNAGVFEGIEMSITAFIIYKYFTKDLKREPETILLYNGDTPPLLQSLVTEAYHELIKEPYSEKNQLSSLKRLFDVLSSSDYITEQNCVAVGLYFSNYSGWRKNLSGPSPAVEEILDDIGLFLKYTVSDPEAAEKNESTPGQLLARIEALES